MAINVVGTIAGVSGPLVTLIPKFGRYLGGSQIDFDNLGVLVAVTGGSVTIINSIIGQVQKETIKECVKIVNSLLKSTKVIDFFAKTIMVFFRFFLKNTTEAKDRFESLNNQGVSGQVEKTGFYTFLTLLVALFLVILLVPALIISFRLNIPFSYYNWLIMSTMFLAAILRIKHQIGEKSKKTDISSFLYKAYDLDLYIAIFVAWIIT